MTARNQRQSSSSRNKNMPPRDEEGKFMSEDDASESSRNVAHLSNQQGSQDDDDRENAESSSRRDRYENDDYRSYRGRGDKQERGGRYDDRMEFSRQHNRQYDDDRPYSARERYDREDDYYYDRPYRARSDYRAGGRDDYYEDRPRRDRNDERHTRSGWFGDSEGHAEAARQGWAQEDDRYPSRGSYRSRERERYDEDDGRSSHGRSSSSRRGHGGWFGDSEGHAEAARQGWEHRR